MILSFTTIIIIISLHPGPFTQYEIAQVNPFGSETLRQPLDTLFSIINPLMTFSSFLIVVYTLLRFHRSSGVERVQMKWVAYTVILGMVIVMAISQMQKIAPENARQFLIDLSFIPSIGFSIAIPIVIGIAILRHRLFDIDIIIRKTITYGALTGLVVLVYALVVGGTTTALQSQNNVVLSLLALGAAAVAFVPARRRLTQLVDRYLPYTPPPTDEAEGANWSLIFLRAAWVMALVVGIGVNIAALPYLSGPIPICDNNPCEGIGPDQINTLADMGISPDLVHGGLLGLEIIAALVWVAAALFIFWGRSDDRLAITASITLLLFGMGVSSPIGDLPAGMLLEASSSIQLFATMLYGLGLLSILFFFYVFPRGKFAAPWLGWLAGLWAALWLSGIFEIGPPLFEHPILGTIQFAIYIASLTGIVVSQVLHYRQTTSPIQRQQIKWVSFGVASACGLIILVFGTPMVFSGSVNPYLLLLMLYPVYFVALLIVPISFIFAILQNHLFDIDIIIRKTITYGALTGLVVLVYAFIVGGTTTALQSQNNVVLSLLALGAAAVAFIPARRRLTQLVDRYLPYTPPPVEKELKEANISELASSQNNLSPSTSTEFSSIAQILDANYDFIHACNDSGDMGDWFAQFVSGYGNAL